eukprot:m.170725 g.170725  ORF g.170725 m.170725 type:complete len:78 (-) comp16488_c3_seq1:1680-1913(-)
MQAFLQLLSQRSSILKPLTSAFVTWASQARSDEFLSAFSAAAAFMAELAVSQVCLRNEAVQVARACQIANNEIFKAA